MQRNHIKLALALLVVALLPACSGKIDVSTLAAKYTSSGGEGLETLELNADGTYVHGWTDYSSALASRTGQWDLGDVDGAKMVTLHDYVPMKGDQGGAPHPFLLKVEHSMGKVHLVPVTDPDHYYAK